MSWCVSFDNTKMCGRSLLDAIQALESKLREEKTETDTQAVRLNAALLDINAAKEKLV